jgi:hypothetical protein
MKPVSGASKASAARTRLWLPVAQAGNEKSALSHLLSAFSLPGAEWASGFISGDFKAHGFEPSFGQARFQNRNPGPGICIWSWSWQENYLQEILWKRKYF